MYNDILLEVIALSINFIISFRNTFFFGWRYFYHKRVYMNLAAVISGATGASYSIYKLHYWLNGVNHIFTCKAVLIGANLLQNSEVIFAFLFLFLKAEASNKLNKKWKYWRILGIIACIIHAIFILLVITNLKAIELTNGSFPICVFKSKKNDLLFKFSAQALNHLIQTIFFIWPLIVQIKVLQNARLNGMNSNQTSLDLYIRLSFKAILGMMVSILYTFILLILLFTVNKNINFASLFIIDASVILMSIHFASTKGLITESKLAKLTGIRSSINSINMTSIRSNSRHEEV